MIEKPYDTHQVELELKYDGTFVPLSIYHSFVDEVCIKESALADYKEALQRKDYYFTNKDGDVVRYREGGSTDNTITVKCRKSDKDITLRHEVDLALKADGHGLKGEDLSKVEGFFRLLGFKREFSILKNSYIYTIKRYAGSTVVLALYDVVKLDKNDEPGPRYQRYLEVEVEKGCYKDLAEGDQELKIWKSLIEHHLQLGKPLNQSLFEIFTNKQYKVRK